MTYFLAAFAVLILASCNRGPVKGDKLNNYFPKDGGGYSVMVTTEQKGFAQASLKKGGQEVATLAISDLVKDPGAKEKFDGAKEKISGYPAIARGSAGTAVLAGRFQVQARSKSDSFSASDRKQWLEKCNLRGLAKIR